LDWPDIATGALVAAGGSARMMPGRKKLAGETPPLALMPLQPAPTSASNTGIASQRNLHFNLTCRV
jgi:hypothetical protein